LVLLLQAERRRLLAVEPAARGPGPELDHGDLDRRQGVREVGVVGADGDALVAGQALEEPQLRPYLGRRLAVLRRGVAGILDDLLQVAPGVEHPGLVDPACEERGPGGGPQVSSLGERAATR